MRAHNRLTARKITSLNKPGRYADGGGLWLQVSSFGTKAWLFRYMRDGKARAMGLGALHTVSLAEARERARRARQQLLDDVDPLAAKQAKRAAAKAEAAKLVTFEEAAAKYIASQKAGWRNAKHADQWTATLETYAYPVIGKLGVAEVDTGLVMKCLEPIWTAKPETASRVRGRIEAVLGWATAHGHRQGDNPARWRGHLQNLLPARAKVAKVEHHAAMPFADVPAFMLELRRFGFVSARALEFTILTAARTGEVIGAPWPEIDLKARVWTVAGDRMKSGREHRVPLSGRALEILAAMPREGDGQGFVFPGGREGKGLSNMALLELLRGMRDGLTVHGFRSSFRDWAAEHTAFPREVAEAALAHVLADKTEAAYRRGDALEKRRRLMDAWAKFCTTPKAEGKILPMAAGRTR